MFRRWMWGRGLPGSGKELRGILMKWHGYGISGSVGRGIRMGTCLISMMESCSLMRCPTTAEEIISPRQTDSSIIAVRRITTIYMSLTRTERISGCWLLKYRVPSILRGIGYILLISLIEKSFTEWKRRGKC